MQEISREVTQAARQQGIEQLFVSDPLAFSQALFEGRKTQFIESGQIESPREHSGQDPPRPRGQQEEPDLPRRGGRLALAARIAERRQRVEGAVEIGGAVNQHDRDLGCGHKMPIAGPTWPGRSGK